ncbi:YcnI family protein [Virgibacillus halophilus]|uniref:YcnI family copper-binding membrane protein n=1 Tax=Tigheibacillus halophilus TaxID=361280 RepID=UPI00363E898C
MTKKWLVSLLSFCFIFAVAHAADAHVTVHPSESTTNAYEKYTVRVPVEKDNNTTEVTLQVPKKVSLVSVLPMNDWDYTLKKNKDGDISSVIWRAKKGGIGPNEFIEFSFIAANPSEPGKISWKALQKYADGSVVEWVGPQNAEEPASVTTIAKGDQAAPHGDHHATKDESAAENNSDSDTPSNDSDTSVNWLPIVLASVAILLSLISLFRKKTS